MKMGTRNKYMQRDFKDKKQVHRQKQEEEKTVEVNEQKKIKAAKTLIKNKE